MFNDLPGNMQTISGHPLTGRKPDNSIPSLLLSDPAVLFSPPGFSFLFLRRRPHSAAHHNQPRKPLPPNQLRQKVSQHNRFGMHANHSGSVPPSPLRATSSERGIAISVSARHSSAGATVVTMYRIKSERLITPTTCLPSSPPVTGSFLMRLPASISGL